MGIYDRDYMRRDEDGGWPGSTPYRTHQPWSGVKNLMVVNIALWALWNLAPDNSRLLAFLEDQFTLVPANVLGGYVWTLFTYSISHLDTWHLALNMLMLWMVGKMLEDRVGKAGFLGLYAAGGVFAGLVHVTLVLGLSPAGASVPTVGASGALMGIMILLACLYQDRWVLIPIPIKMKWLAFIYVGVDLLGLVNQNPADRVAHAAHLGGALFGYLYYRYSSTCSMLVSRIVRRVRARRTAKLTRMEWPWDEQRAAKRAPGDAHASPRPGPWTVRASHEDSPDDEERKVDAILEKIMRSGLKSLSPEERATLDRHSKSRA